MSDVPVLVLGFNRPESVSRVFKALSITKPKVLLFAVDGPRHSRTDDEKKVIEVQNSINQIDWKATIKTRFRESNLGLRKAVPDAVSWAISDYGRVAVLEDDAIPGPDFLNYMTMSLNNFENDNSVGHISGYNQVPKEFLSEPTNLYRRSNYPESYAWGTWERSWRLYEDNLSTTDLIEYESIISKIIWNNNFNLAEKDLISTWAFRWVASLWSNNLECISPNVNLIDYVGHAGGTHTRRKPRATEQQISSFSELNLNQVVKFDQKADAWTSDVIFHENLKGLLEIKIAKYALSFLKKFNL